MAKHRGASMKVIIPRHIHDQIDYYVQNTNIEISGLGRVKKHTNGDMEVVKVYLLEQENTASHTELDGEAVASLMYQTRKDEGDLNFWWHSHVDMGVFWSGTDMSTIKEFGKNGYLLSTVFNKKGEMRSSYFQGGNEFFPPLFMDELKTVVTRNVDPELATEWKKEMAEKCKAKTYTYPNLNGPLIHRQGTWWEKREERRLAQKQREKDAKKQRKGKRGKSKKSTVLAENNGYTDGLKAVMDDSKIEQWRECLGALRDQDPVNINDETLWTFYELWEGNYDDMQAHVVTQVAMAEMDKEFEDTELWGYGI